MTLTKRQKEYYEFWSNVLEAFENKKPNVTSGKPSKTNFLKLKVCKNVYFEWRFKGSPPRWFLVELHFEFTECERNKQLLYFISKKVEIQKEFSEKLEFDDSWGEKKKWTRIFITRNSGNFDNENKIWGVENMVKFYDIFMPYLKVKCI